MNYQEALDKAAKLLRLSKSSNANEAALALGKAQEIMERFKIDAATFEYDKPQAQPEEPIKDFGADPLDTAGGSWRWRLALPLARQNQCKVYLMAGRPCLIGRPSDVATVRYFYGWLVGEIDRLTRKECSGNGRTYANNFRIGVIETLKARLEAQKQETHAAMKAEAETAAASNGMALMRLNMSIARIEQRTKAVEQWAATNMRLRKSYSSGGRFDSGARDHGRKAGHSIRLGSAGSLKGAACGALAGC